MRKLLLIVALTAVAHADPHARKPPTQADLDRLEKRVDEQQQKIDALVALQQQYLRALLAMFPDGTTPVAAPAARSPEPAPIKPIEPKPAIIVDHIKPKPSGSGTVVGKVKGGSGDTFVYIEDITAPAHGTATMKQEGRQVVPRVLAVQKGTKVDFPNLDAVFHNVFSVTPDNSFDLGSYRQGESRSVSMVKPGVINVYCNMHPEMVGYILVVPSALYTRAGQDGFFKLTNVPAGKHRIVAWAPNSKPVTIEADVAENEAATVELEIHLGRQLPHTNKDGMAYGSYKE